MKRTNEEKRLYDSYKSAIKNKQTPCFSKEEWMTLFQYLNRENKDDAFNVLDSAIEAYPDHRPFIITKAELALYDGLLDEAYDLLEIELADAPEGEVKHLWIDYYYSSGEDKKARQLLDDLFERKPKYMERTLEYIIPVLSDSLDEDSHKFYTPYIQNAAKLFPKNPLLLEEWEKELMIQKRYEEAIGVCNQLIDNDPYSFMYWNDLAHLHMMQGEYEQAIEALDFALTISAEKEQVNQTKVFKGYCLYMNGSYEQAIELYQELSDNGRTEWEVNSLIAHCHVQMQHFDEAYEILKELIKHDEQEAYAIAMHDFVICCMMKGKREEAYQALKVAVSKHPLDEGLLMVYSLFGIFDKKKMPEIKNTIDRSITLLCPGQRPLDQHEMLQAARNRQILSGHGRQRERFGLFRPNLAHPPRHGGAARAPVAGIRR